MTRKVFCGVPETHCNGGIVTGNAMWDWRRRTGGRDVAPKSARLHNSHEEAFRCHRRFLISQGYKKLSEREFETPEGTVRVLDKKSQFGMEWRAGKEGDKSSSRFVPLRGRGAIVEAVER